MSLYKQGSGAAQSVAWVLALVVVCGCGETTVEEKPAAPNMDALIADYRTPTADLTSETLPLILDALVMKAELLTGTGGLGFLLDDIIGPVLADDSQNSGLTHAESGLRTRTQALDVSADGFARVTRVCNGWDGGTTPNTLDGSINLTMGFTGNNDIGAQIDPVVWGSFLGCKYGVASESGVRKLMLDGAVQIWLSDNFSAAQLAAVDQSPILLDIAGKVTLDDDIELDDLNFALDLGTGAIEFKLPVQGGHVLFGFEGETNRFRAANGVWACNFEAATCDCTDQCSGSASSFSW